MNKDRKWNSNQCTRAREWSGRSRFQIAFIIKHATRENSKCTVGMVRSSSGDIIIIPATHVYWSAMGQENTARSQTWVTANCQENKKSTAWAALLYWQWLCFQHSSRGRQLYWKHVKENSAFLDLFATLANGQCITSDQLAWLEHFVCTIFGRRQQHTVNEARKEIFGEKLEKDRKVINLCLLPPCKLVWNYIASNRILWQRCGEMHQILF